MSERHDAHVTAWWRDWALTVSKQHDAHVTAWWVHWAAIECAEDWREQMYQDDLKWERGT